MNALRGALAAAAVAVLASCTGVTYAETPVPAPPSSAPSTPAPPAAAPTCTNATQSYDPLPELPASPAITDRSLRSVIDRGYLVVGISADTYLFGARDPFTGRLEGFDIDMARAVAKSLFGDASKIQFRVITAAERIPVLTGEDSKGNPVERVDMVARNMTMTCSRWEQIAFSSEYYHSGQKVLVAKGSKAQTLEDLAGQRVCAPTGTSSLDKLRTFREVEVVTAPNHTGCLVLFQQGRADAITGDDTVLAGLSAQDPYTVVTKAPPITAEPYGLAFNRGDVYFVRYVNRLLEEMRSDGRWKAIYTKWLAGPLGPAPAPPKPVHGRDA